MSFVCVAAIVKSVEKYCWTMFMKDMRTIGGSTPNNWNPSKIATVNNHLHLTFSLPLCASSAYQLIVQVPKALSFSSNWISVGIIAKVILNKNLESVLSCKWTPFIDSVVVGMKFRRFDKGFYWFILDHSINTFFC